MLLGSFDGKIKNGGILMPEAFRPFLASKKLFLFSPEAGCLEIIPVDKLTEEKAKTPYVGIGRLKGDGHLVIPQKARRMAGLAGPEVVILGLVDKVEVWEPNAYNRIAEENFKRLEEVLKAIT